MSQIDTSPWPVKDVSHYLLSGVLISPIAGLPANIDPDRLYLHYWLGDGNGIPRMVPLDRSFFVLPGQGLPIG